MTVRTVDQDTAHDVISSATNSRQATKVLDVRSESILVAERDTGITVYITSCDLGIHAVWTRGGVYCDDRHLDLTALVGAVDSADQLDIEQDPSSEIQRITWCEERDAE